ncbi:bestrophin homolog 24 [Anabrus simplex]|uniref:bestrophin homolog 24 n=1 Tax=Anabrus simplex TaxID=316456 RepID=UPI0035A33EE0
MTVTYTGEVATCTGLGCFWKLLFRWRGSIYKLLWPNLVVYSIVYFSLSFVYRFLLSDENRLLFERLALHCQTYNDLIPIAFVLGFYVSIVIKRWWDQYICMPWPDNLSMFVSTLVHGQDDRGRLMRRTIVRYVNLCLVITLRMMSPRVKKRFPSMDHLVEAGFLQPNEKKIFEDLDQKTSHAKYWMPLVWAGGIITRARKEARIKDDFALKTLIDELNRFRAGCGGMLNYDWISIPLVYTQVVTLAVYVYFMGTLMGNQFLDPRKKYPKHEVDLVVPIFTFLQFFFYMGWLKVAESLVNPFGEDDDDFEVNWLVDRNLQVSYLIVDEMHQEHPEMVKDQYWDEVIPQELPYTAASKQYHTGPPPCSADYIDVDREAEFMPMESAADDIPDERDDLDMDMDMDEIKADGSRRETHPMRILKSKKGSSSNSINTCSLSGVRTGRKNSVLNMLTNLFRRENSSPRDLGSNMGSSASLRSRRGPRCSSRLSSMSQSQAQSRTSMARENTFQDEMFRMSDVSLCGSTLTVGSQIQMVAHPTPIMHSETDYNTEYNESSQLIPPSKYRNYRTHKDKYGGGDNLEIQRSFRDDVSDVSGSSIKTSYFHELDVDVQGSGTTPDVRSPSRLTDSYKQVYSSSTKQEWKDIGTGTTDEGGGDADSSDSATRIVIPCSPPIRHTFLPVAPIIQQAPIYPERRRSGSTSSLSRSLQQYRFTQPVPTISYPDSAVINANAPAANSFFPQSSVIPSVSLASAVVPTTSIVTSVASNLPVTVTAPSMTVSSSVTTNPIPCSTVVHILEDTDSEASSTSIDLSGIVTPSRAPTPPKYEAPVPTTLETIMEEPAIKTTELSVDVGQSASVGAGPPQYVPSAAIPVPSVSPAHTTQGTGILENGLELIEAALAPMSRRGHHDYHELEPISEHGETSVDSSTAVKFSSDEEKPPDEPPRTESVV